MTDNKNISTMENKLFQEQDVHVYNMKNKLFQEQEQDVHADTMEYNVLEHGDFEIPKKFNPGFMVPEPEEPDFPREIDPGIIMPEPEKPDFPREIDPGIIMPEPEEPDFPREIDPGIIMPEPKKLNPFEDIHVDTTNIDIRNMLMEYAADKENNNLYDMMRKNDISVSDLKEYLEFENKYGSVNVLYPEQMREEGMFKISTYDPYFGCNPNDGSPIESRMPQMIKYLEETVIPDIEEKYPEEIKNIQMDNMTKDMQDIYKDYLDMIKEGEDLDSSDLMAMFEEEGYGIRELVDYMNYQNEKNDSNNNYTPYDPYFGTDPKDGSPIESRVNAMAKYLEETFMPQVNENTYTDRVVYNIYAPGFDIPEGPISREPEPEKPIEIPIIARPIIRPDVPIFRGPKPEGPIEMPYVPGFDIPEEPIEMPYEPGFIIPEGPIFREPEPEKPIEMPNDPGFTIPNDPGLNGPDFEIPNDPGIVIPNDPGLNGPDFEIPNDPGIVIPNDPGLNGPDFKTPEKPSFDGPVRPIRDIGTGIGGAIKEGIASLRGAISEKEDFEKVEQNVVSNSTYSKDMFTSKDDVSAEKESDLTSDFDVSL